MISYNSCLSLCPISFSGKDPKKKLLISLLNSLVWCSQPGCSVGPHLSRLFLHTPSKPIGLKRLKGFLVINTEKQKTQRNKHWRFSWNLGLHSHFPTESLSPYSWRCGCYGPPDPAQPRYLLNSHWHLPNRRSVLPELYHNKKQLPVNQDLPRGGHQARHLI